MKNYKNKYLKYKLKYIELKNNEKKNNILKGGAELTNTDIKLSDKNILLEIIEKNLKNNNWNKKTIILDCISETKMQTETNKLINYIINKKIIKPSKKQLEIALIYSVFCGYYIIVEELLKFDINSNILYNNMNLVDIAIGLYFFKTAKILMKNNSLSKNFYNQNQIISDQYNFSHDYENIINNNIIDKKEKLNYDLYYKFKEILLKNSTFNFSNLNRNIVKKLKNNINII